MNSKQVEKANYNIKKVSEASSPSTLLLPPEWIICTHDRPAPHVVDFKEMFAIKSSIIVLQLLWNYNCYFVDVKRRRFVINGGRNIFISDWKDVQNVEILYAKRHTKTVQLNKTVEDGSGKHEITYLLGIQGTLDGERKEVLIHISPNGKEWYWRDKR